MANEYLVNSSDLTAVADAIRTKGGTSDALPFPGGFVSAVQAINAGGGSGIFGLSENDFLQSNGTLESYTNNEITAITTMPSPFGALKTKYLRFNNLIRLGGSKFVSHGELLEFYAPALMNHDNFTWRYDNKLRILDIGLSSISNYDCNGCSALEIIIIRNTDSVVNLGGTTPNFPSGTPFGDGTGTVYVPQALIESYKTATNWSYLYGINPDVFQPLEGSEYE